MEVGLKNNLRVDRFTDPGAYLLDDENNEVLLPNKYIPEGLKEGEDLEVFVYLDSEDRIIATTLEPYVYLNSFACLKVKDVNNIGAFLDWGLEKDLFVPFKEQGKKLEIGQDVVVFMYKDFQTDRLVASTKLDSFVLNDECELEEGQEVDLLIANRTDLGRNAIIDNEYIGLIYKNEIFQDLYIGDKIKGYVKKIREEGKIDIALQKQGVQNIDDASQKVLTILKDNNGSMEVSDKSAPEEIKALFSMSKKSFKKAIGSLYKSKIIKIEDNKITLL